MLSDNRNHIKKTNNIIKRALRCDDSNKVIKLIRHCREHIEKECMRGTVRLINQKCGECGKMFKIEPNEVEWNLLCPGCSTVDLSEFVQKVPMPPAGVISESAAREARTLGYVIRPSGTRNDGGYVFRCCDFDGSCGCEKGHCRVRNCNVWVI